MSHDAPVQAVPGVIATIVAHRYGVKGAGAPAWLARQSVVVPAAPNQIARFSGDGGRGRCLRLGHGEFLVEFDAPPVGAPAAGTPPAALPGESVWTLVRSDHCLRLEGAHWPQVLAAACSYDFTRFDTAPDQVVMTLLAGIGVTLVREHDAPHAWRLWCDASYADYLQQVLQALAAPISPAPPEPTGDIR